MAADIPASHRATTVPGIPLASRRRVLTWAALPGSIAALLLVVALTPFLPLAAHDLGLVGVLSTDEELAGRIVRHMLAVARPSTNGFYSYGALLFDIAFVLLLPFEAAGSVSDQAIVLTLRSVALAGGAGAVLLTAILAHRLGGLAAAWIAAVAMALTPELVEWSITAHPDTLQLALLAATLLVATMLLDRPSLGILALAGALAGLTFATKYLGVFLVPSILLAATAGQARGDRAITLRTVTVDATVLGLAFILAFAVTNPYAVAEPRGFLEQLRAELIHASTGHVFIEGNGGWGWLRTAHSPALGGPLLPFLGLMGAVWSVLTLARRWEGGAAMLRRVDARALLALWLLGYLGFLVARTGYGAPRYALPLLPAALSLGAMVVVDTLRLMRRRAGTGSVAAVAIILAVSSVLPAARAAQRLDARHERAQRLEHDPRVIAGRWLDAEAPEGATILRDAYSYLPPRRTGSPVTFGLTEAQVERLRPDYIVVNEDIRGRFRWELGAERYVDGPSAYFARMAAYAKLEAGQLCGYTLLRDFGTVQVYTRAALGQSGC